MIVQMLAGAKGVRIVGHKFDPEGDTVVCWVPSNAHLVRGDPISDEDIKRELRRIGLTVTEDDNGNWSAAVNPRWMEEDEGEAGRREQAERSDYSNPIHC